MGWRRFLGLGGESAGLPALLPETDSVRRITRELESLPFEQARFIAAFAYVLSRVAHADLDISPLEIQAMERLVAEKGGLGPGEARLVVEIARAQNVREGATENFLVTREFGRIASREQKLHLVECMYAVAAAHGLVSQAEDDEIRRIASELALDHRDVIAIRSAYRDRLAVMQNLPRWPSASGAG